MAVVWWYLFPGLPLFAVIANYGDVMTTLRQRKCWFQHHCCSCNSDMHPAVKGRADSRPTRGNLLFTVNACCAFPDWLRNNTVSPSYWVSIHQHCSWTVYSMAPTPCVMKDREATGYWWNETTDYLLRLLKLEAVLFSGWTTHVWDPLHTVVIIAEVNLMP